MASVLITRHQLFQIFESNHFQVHSNEAIQEVCRLIEQQIGLNLINPVSDSLKNEIKSKFYIIHDAWLKLDSSGSREKFINESLRKSYKINVSTCDLEREKLTAEYQAYKNRCDDLSHEKNKLEINVKQLQSELRALQNRLIKTESDLKAKREKKADKHVKKKADVSLKRVLINNPSKVALNKPNTVEENIEKTKSVSCLNKETSPLNNSNQLFVIPSKHLFFIYSCALIFIPKTVSL
jgi:hypothetical protein